MNRTGPASPAALLVIIAALAAMAVSLLLPVQSAFAHANLVKAEPSPNSALDRPPERVIIWFTEPLEPEFSEIRVLDAQGRGVDLGDSFVDSREPTTISVSLEPLPNGTYTVAWKNLSTVDGHRVRGSFVFSVGEPISGEGLVETQEQPLLQSPSEPVLRWLVLLSALTIVGGLGFEMLVSRPILMGRASNQSLRQLGARMASRALKLIWLAVGVLLLSSLGQLLVQASVVHDISIVETFGSPLKTVLVDTNWGHLWLWRVGLLAALVLALSLAFFIGARGRGNGAVNNRRNNMQAETLHRLLRILALGIGGGMLITLSLISHGAATAGVRSAAVFSDYLHLLAAGFWVGGLFHFALGVPMVMRSLGPDERRSVLSALVPRFSVLAALSVGTLIITGLYGAWAQVTTPAAANTPYGLTLAAKLGMVAPLLLLGALNLLWVRPRLSREGPGHNPGYNNAGRWLGRLVLGEAVLAVLVLLSVGVLTSLEPARQVASRQGVGQEAGLSFQDTAEGADITLNIEPGQVGPNKFLVSIKDRLGSPITNASDVSLRLTFLDVDLGEAANIAAPAGDGQYVVEDALLSIAGPWQAELVVRRPDAFDARTAFRFEVESGGVVGSAAIAPSADTGRVLWGVELALLGFLFLGAGIPLGGWWTRRGAVVMGPGIVAVVIGFVLIANTQFAGESSQEVLRNPFPPNPESLEMGRQVYQGNCQSCHGVAGRGDGPLSPGLDPPPADLVIHVPLHPEGDLFRFIYDGIPGTAMAPLGGVLSDDEIWHLVNYISTFEE